MHYKGDLPPSEDPDIRLSEGEQSVVDAVRESNPDDATVSAALDSYNAGMGSDDDSSDDSTSDDDVAEEDDSEAIENSTVPPMLRNASVTRADRVNLVKERASCMGALFSFGNEVAVIVS